MGRKILFPGLAVLGLLGIWGHVAFWYLPREHARTPDGSDLPARLLVSGAYENALWIPYPHQNLGEMSDAVGDPEGWLAAVARVAGVPPPTARAFGPFSVPPAREITVAADEDGERALAAARIYPLVAWVARLAGKVAGNPWLGGGVVQGRGGTAHVAWNGTLWTVRLGPEPELPLEADPPRETLLGAVALRQPKDLFPAGLYSLRSTEPGGYELSSTGPGGALEPAVDDLAGSGVLLALLDGPGPPLESLPSALLIFDRQADHSIELPAAAVLYRETEGLASIESEDAEARTAERIREDFLSGSSGAGSGEELGLEDASEGRLRLPQERLPRLLRGELRESAAAGLAIVASDPSALAAATELAPEVASVLAHRGAGVVLWISPGPLGGLIDRGVELLEQIPLVSSSDLRQWRDWRTVLLPLDGYERILLVRTSQPAGFRLVVTPRAPSE